MKSIDVEIAQKEEEKRQLQEQLKSCQGTSLGPLCISLVAVAGDDGRGDAGLTSSGEQSKHAARPRVGSTQTKPQEPEIKAEAGGGEDGKLWPSRLPLLNFFSFPSPL